MGRRKHKDRTEILFKHAYREVINRQLKRWPVEGMLTFLEFKALVVGECYWCGFVGSNKFSDGKHSDTILRINGLDRIDNSVGYLLSNVRCSCRFCNIARNTMTESYFLAWVKLVHDHMKL